MIEVSDERDIYFYIGQNIKRYRREKGYTGEELAKLCNLSYGYIKNLESEKVNATLSIETLELIANKLNIDIKKFFDKDF